jgi:hypothetical protein
MAADAGLAAAGSRRECVQATLADHLRWLTPDLPRTLVSAAAAGELQRVGRRIPAALGTYFGLEFRLGDPTARADLLVRTTRGWGGPRILATLDPDSTAGAAAASVSRFAAFWGSGVPGPGEELDDVWVEFDVAAGSARAAAPSLFFHPRPKGGNHLTRPVAAKRCVEIVAAAFAAFSGEPAPRALLDRFASSLSKLPRFAWVFQVGMMRRPGQPRLRVCVHELGLDPALDYLAAVGWAGDLEAVRRRIEPLARIADRLTVCFDLDTAVGPRAGFELYLAHLRQPAVEPRWAELLARLVADGLSTDAKREALLAVPGQTLPASARDRPAGLACAEALLRGRRSCVLQRALHHVKISCTAGLEDAAAEAKAYLAVAERWTDDEAATVG